MPERVFRWVCVVLESLCFGRSVLRSGVFVKAGVCVGWECVLVQECISQRKYIWLSGVCDGAGLCFGVGVCVVFSV